METALLDSLLNTKFGLAVRIMRNWPNGDVPLERQNKLELYGLYKQATTGNCSLSKPPFFELLNKAKWQAWAKNKDIDKTQAKLYYVNLVVQFIKLLKDRPQLQQMCEFLQSNNFNDLSCYSFGDLSAKPSSININNNSSNDINLRNSRKNSGLEETDSSDSILSFSTHTIQAPGDHRTNLNSNETSLVSSNDTDRDLAIEQLQTEVTSLNEKIDSITRILRKTTEKGNKHSGMIGYIKDILGINISTIALIAFVVINNYPQLKFVNIRDFLSFTGNYKLLGNIKQYFLDMLGR